MSEPLSVLEFNTRVNQLFRSDPDLSRVAVRGEISGYKRYPSGHAYFTLKDQEASVSCVLFRSRAPYAPSRMTEGMKVVIQGAPNVYDKTGRFQLVAESIREEKGVGDLYRQFLVLKEKLEKEGLFDASRKKPIPFIPRRVVAVTSSQGAVIRDIIHVIQRRFPGMRLILVETPVQGTGAERLIASAIETVNRLRLGDVIIVGRGGGSMEDLQPFNEEITARAIAASDIPVISAVGHETDYTIADFVADLRAPTPSVAAELSVPVKSDLLQRVDQRAAAIEQAMFNRLLAEERHVMSLAKRPVLQNPCAIVDRHALRLDFLSHELSHVHEKRFTRENHVTERLCRQLKDSMRQYVSEASYRYTSLRRALDALSPYAILSRGYAVLRKKDGSWVTRGGELRAKDAVDALFRDGSVELEVTRPLAE